MRRLRTIANLDALETIALLMTGKKGGGETAFFVLHVTDSLVFDARHWIALIPEARFPQSVFSF
jgi:hypothetical protein